MLNIEGNTHEPNKPITYNDTKDFLNRSSTRYPAITFARKQITQLAANVMCTGPAVS